MKTYLSVLVIVLSFVLISCSNEQTQTTQNTSDAERVDAQDALAIASEQTENSCFFKMGFDVWEPYQYKDVENSVRGLDIELISAVTERMNCDVEFVQGTWVSLLEDLQQGEVDILLGASKTKARETFAYFSEPYRTEEFALYIRADDSQRAAYKDIDEFLANGSKIGLVGDYFYGDELSVIIDSEEAQDQFVFGIMGELNIARLLDMDIDGFLEDNFVGASMLRRKALENLIEVHPFSIKTGDIYVMFSQASIDQAQVDAFNKALNAFKRSDEYRAILRKYGK